MDTIVALVGIALNIVATELLTFLFALPTPLNLIAGFLTFVVAAFVFALAVHWTFYLIGRIVASSVNGTLNRTLWPVLCFIGFVISGRCLLGVHDSYDAGRARDPIF